MQLQKFSVMFVICLLVAAAAYWFGKHAASPSVVADKPVDMRALVADEIQKVSGQVTQGNLDDYLNGLIAKAEQAGRATALEVEPGIERIMALTDNPDKVAEFSARMQAINGVGKQALTPREAEFKLTQLSDAIAVTERGSDEFNSLVNEYIDAAHYLPGEEGIDAVSRLNELLPNDNEFADVVDAFDPESIIMSEGLGDANQQPMDSEATKSALLQLGQQIGNASSNEERNQLLNEYMGLLGNLEPEESMQALEELSIYLPQAESEQEIAPLPHELEGLQEVE